MKIFRQRIGPFTERPYYTDSDMENMCLDALRKVDLYPSSPSPIRIDRFAEKHFNISLRYESLPEGVLGLTLFGKNGVQDIVIAEELDSEGSQVSKRRIRSTIAHEAGHGLFHTHLYLQNAITHPEFIDLSEPKKPKMLCRDVEGVSNKTNSNYHGKWWEFQANQAIGAFLLPRHLVITALDSMLINNKFTGKILDENKREKAVALIAETFDVNPAAARIRVNKIFTPQIQLMKS